MAYGSGLGASFGLKKEGVFGTGVTVDRWLPGESFYIKPEITTEPVWGLAAGRLAPTDEVVTGTKGVGQWVGQVPTTKFGPILQGLFGVTPTPTQQAATAAYLQAYTTPADNYGFSYTCQAGAPITTGTVNPYTGTGGKITAVEFSSQINTPLKATVDFNFQNVVDSTALTSPSYVASSVLNKLTVKLGTFNSEAAVTGISAASVKIERPMDTERPGYPGAYPEPISNDTVKITGTLEAQFTDETYFNDRFIGHTSTALVLEWMRAMFSSAARRWRRRGPATRRRTKAGRPKGER